MSQFWWESEKNAVHTDLFTQIRYLDKTQTSIQQANLRHMRLYLSQDISSLSYSGFVQTRLTSNGLPHSGTTKSSLSVNIVKSCIDTLVSKIAKSKIKPTFLTDKGDFNKQEQAKKLNQFVSGLAYDIKLARLAPMVAKDSFIAGTGFLKVYSENDVVKADRIFPDEILVDNVDGYYGDPRCIYQRRFVSRDVLKASWPDKAHLFDTTPAIPRPDGGGQTHIEVCLIGEAWKLPDSQDADGAWQGGRHVIAVDNVTLLDEEWDKPRFPFAVLRYTEESLGYFGRGIAEELTGHQIEINRITRFISDSMQIAGGIKVWIEAGSKVASSKITNATSSIAEYVGTPPVFQVVQPVAPDYFNRLESLKREAYEVVGISQMSATSKDTLGPSASGSARRAYHEIESERFMLTGQAYESFHIDVVELAVDEVKRIIDRQKLAKKKDPKVKVGYRTKAFSRQDGVVSVDWKEIDLDEDSTVLQCFPTSALPSEPGAKIQTIVEMSQAGLLTPDESQDLLDFPDTEAVMQRKNAPRRILVDILEGMLRDGVYVSPEPNFNLQLGLSLAQEYYNLGKTMKVSDDRLECLRNFISDTNRLMTLATPPAPPAAPGPQGQPLAGVPAAPPVSPMLPNVG